MEPLIVSLDFLEFPPGHTADGGNLSPRLAITGLLSGTASLAVMVTNPFIKSCCSFTPWLAWNLPPLPSIPPGIPPVKTAGVPVSAVQGTNDYGIAGYTGPNPPPGETHRYQFRVYGLDAMLDLMPGSRKHELVAAMRGHVLQYGETAAICTR